ncbi:MAG: hypothetical protein MRJ96_15240 [Nitrospirales bacterium]|nr:hypothetical protein [Nitrospira sp.]MDR4502797.1 hypothetical protein [Nitrospirales bacterium]
MRIWSVIWCLLWLTLLALPAMADDGQGESIVSVRIDQPANGDLGEWRTKVSGTVSNSLAKIWVVVRPLETRDFWVQPRTTVEANGEWETLIYLGGEDSSHAGKIFDVQAIANPEYPLNEGLILPGWPRAEGKSNVVRVVRK